MAKKPLPLDPASIARNIHQGIVVHLGKNTTLHRAGNDLVYQCRHCVIEGRLRYDSLVRDSLDQERLAQFLYEHQHQDKEPAS